VPELSPKAEQFILTSHLVSPCLESTHLPPATLRIVLNHGAPEVDTLGTKDLVMTAALYLLSRSANGALQGKTRLLEGRLIVGRSPQADLYFPDVSVSRRHAELIVSGTTLVVRDLNSRNGTYVDGQRVQETPVRPQQRLRFGNVELLLAESNSLPAGLVAEDEETADIRQAGQRALMHPALEVLTGAQRRVFNLLMQGQPQKLIARELGISPHTVHNHTRVIYRAFGVHTRAELMARVQSQPD
jgi:DNA-binding CsgD family transcriptional regulator